METASDAKRTRAPWRFFVYSGIGIIGFFIPLPIAGETTILLDHVVGWIEDGLGEIAPYVALLIIVAGTVYQFASGRWKKSFSRRVFAFLNVFGVVAASMLVFGFGPSFLFAEDLGPFLYNSLVIPVGILVPIGALFLAMLIGFGLMNFMGVLVQPFMRPVFKVPGRSAVDAVASFVGSYSLGLIITNRLYRTGGYSAREAAIIAAGFSTASATFMVVIARTLDLMHIWTLYFLLTLIVTFVVTAITVHLPPLRTMSREYYPGVEPQPEEVVTGSRIRAAWKQVSLTLEEAPSLWRHLWNNFQDGVKMAMQILPGIMSVGLIGLTLATYTPLFTWLGYIFYPLTYILQIPDPQLASEALAIGLAELFLPATLVAGHSSEVLKLIIAVVSVSQIFFFSAMIPAVLATDIPLKIWHMVVIWFQRVVLSLVVATPLAYLVVGIA